MFLSKPCSISVENMFYNAEKLRGVHGSTLQSSQLRKIIPELKKICYLPEDTLRMSKGKSQFVINDSG